MWFQEIVKKFTFLFRNKSRRKLSFEMWEFHPFRPSIHLPMAVVLIFWKRIVIPVIESLPGLSTAHGLSLTPSEDLGEAAMTSSPRAVHLFIVLQPFSLCPSLDPGVCTCKSLLFALPSCPCFYWLLFMFHIAQMSLTGKGPHYTHYSPPPLCFKAFLESRNPCLFF